MSDEPTTRSTLSRVARIAAEAALYGARVAMPARVTKYDAARQTVDAEPLVMDGVETDGTRKPEAIAIVQDAPVMFLGGGGFSETFPIEAGDTVLLVFCSSSIERWKSSGGLVDPGDDRRHHVGDAVAYAGIRDFAHALAGVPSDAWRITAPGGKEIQLGGSGATHPAAKSDVLTEVLTKLVSAIAAGLAGAVPVTPGPTTAPAALFQAALTAAGYSVSVAQLPAEKVKIE